MNIITSVNDTKFALNGIEYLKNYVSAVYGNKIEIFNCYERKDVLLQQTNFNDFIVNGLTYTNAAALQTALLPILYSRNTLGDGGFDIGQDNIDIKKTFLFVGTLTPSQFLARVNSLPTYTVNEVQSVWFVGQSYTQTSLREQASIHTTKYKMLNKGKNTYGTGGIQLTLQDIELVYHGPSAITDIETAP